MMAASTSSVLWAEWRRGLKDLQNAVLNPWNGVTQTHEESGSIGNPTQQIVTEDIRGDQSFDAMLVRHAAARGPEPKEQGLERE
jgi:hypothetical protein